MSTCSHSAVMGELCVACGIHIISLPREERAQLEASLTQRLIVNKQIMRVTPKEHSLYRNNNTKDLLSRKKLALVLDLDKTQIHATGDRTLHDFFYNVEEKEEMSVKQVRNDLHRIELFRADPANHIIDPHFIKVRYGVRSFLERMSCLFDIYVYTMGVRNYADAIVDIIDPLGRTIKNRVMSRDEGEAAYKNLDSLIPVLSSCVICLDDLKQVWLQANNVQNLFPYNFFVENGQTPVSTMLKSQKPVDNVLLMVNDAQTAIHACFFRFPQSAYRDNTGIHTAIRKEQDIPSITTALEVYLRKGYAGEFKLPLYFTILSEEAIQSYSKHIPVQYNNAGVPQLHGRQVTSLLEWSKAASLQSCRLGFSGVVAKDTPFHENRDVIIATECGAIVYEQVPAIYTEILPSIEELSLSDAQALKYKYKLTHLVCRSVTEKVKLVEPYNNWVEAVWNKFAERDENQHTDVCMNVHCKEYNRDVLQTLPQPLHIVHISWLHACNNHWYRLYEGCFLLQCSSSFAFNQAGGDLQFFPPAQYTTEYESYVNAKLPQWSEERKFIQKKKTGIMHRRTVNNANATNTTQEEISTTDFVLSRSLLEEYYATQDVFDRPYHVIQDFKKYDFAGYVRHMKDSNFTFQGEDGKVISLLEARYNYILEQSLKDAMEGDMQEEDDNTEEDDEVDDFYDSELEDMQPVLKKPRLSETEEELIPVVDLEDVADDWEDDWS